MKRVPPSIRIFLGDVAAIAVTRFGLGARPGEIDAAKVDPQGFLIGQIRREGADIPQDGGDTSAQRFEQMRQYQQQSGPSIRI